MFREYYIKDLSKYKYVLGFCWLWLGVGVLVLDFCFREGKRGEGGVFFLECVGKWWVGREGGSVVEEVGEVVD